MIWVPFHARSMTAQFAEQRGASILHVIGHLRAGATIAQAQAELGTIAQKKTVEFRVSYNQSRMRDIAVQIIERALVGFSVAA